MKTKRNIFCSPGDDNEITIEESFQVAKITKYSQENNTAQKLVLNLVHYLEIIFHSLYYLFFLQN